MIEERRFHYDFVGLTSRNFDDDPSDYYNPDDRLIRITHSQNQKKILNQYIKIYGSSSYGFGSLLSQSHMSKHYREAIDIPTPAISAQ